MLFALGTGWPSQSERAETASTRVFFFKQKTAYEIGLGIPAEPLFRSLNPTYQAGLRRDAVQPDIEAERKKRDEIEAGKSYCSRRFGGATCDDKSAQIYARFDKNDWRIQ